MHVFHALTATLSDYSHEPVQRKLAKGEPDVAKSSAGTMGGSFKMLDPDMTKSPTILTLDEITYDNKAFQGDEYGNINEILSYNQVWYHGTFTLKSANLH